MKGTTENGHYHGYWNVGNGKNATTVSRREGKKKKLQPRAGMTITQGTSVNTITSEGREGFGVIGRQFEGRLVVTP